MAKRSDHPDQRGLFAESPREAKTKKPAESETQKGRRLRDSGIQKAADNSGRDWQQEAEDFMYRWARTHAQFSADELFRAGLPTPRNDKRAMGAVVVNALKAGWVKKSGASKPGMNPKCHRGPKAILISLIFKSEASNETRNEANN